MTFIRLRLIFILSVQMVDFIMLTVGIKASLMNSWVN